MLFTHVSNTVTRFLERLPEINWMKSLWEKKKKKLSGKKNRKKPLIKSLISIFLPNFPLRNKSN